MSAASQPVWQRVLIRSWQQRGWLAWLLWPLSWPLHGLVRLRRALYRSGLLRSEGVPVPVIVVGNVIAGGAGKTPVVQALVRHLQACGRRPGVISRGYGRQTDDCREVLTDSRATEVGDEPLLIRRSTAAPVFVARRRVAAARALLQRYPDTDVLVCDDGLQHLALQRDIDICVFDDRCLGNGLLLPAGPLRESWPRPVNLVLLNAPCPGLDGFRAQRRLQPFARRADGSQLDLATLGQPGQPPLLALAGIARPEAFFAMLRAQGLSLTRTLALPDHFDFASWTAPSEAPYTLLCTEKDAVKLWPRYPEALAVGLDLAPEPAFLEALDRLLANASRAKLSS